jgi:hypothetical protein
MLRRARREEDGVNAPDEYFERRLVEETSKVRVELAGVEVRLSERIAQSEGALRQEISGLEGMLRRDINGLELRMERNMGTLRADVLRWAFLFWLGQVAVMMAILRAYLPR